MKKTIKLFGLFVVAAMTVIGCAKEVDAPEEATNETPTEQSTFTHTVTITAGAPTTKTVINEGETSASFKWSSDDATRFHVWENDVKGTAVTLTSEDEYETMKLTATFASVSAASYEYTAYLAKNEYDDDGDKYPQVPSEQTCTATSYDPNADILVAQPVTSVGSTLDEIEMRFGRPCVINKMTLKGLTAGETLSSVEIRSDKPLAGYYDADGQSWTGQSSKIVLTTSQTVSAAGEATVYFITMPVAEATLTVTAITNAHVYDKTFTKTIDFLLDQVTVFGVANFTKYTKRDVLTLDLTKVSAGSGYANFSGKSYSGAGKSPADYAGTIAGGNSAIQINWNSGTSYRGIVTTTSGGSIEKIRVLWNSGTSDGRSLDVYGKNSAYTTSDLNNSFGTSIGSITKGASIELKASKYFEYIMFKSTQAIYLDEIEVFWGNTKNAAGIKWTADGKSGATVSSATATMLTGDDSMPAAALFNPNEVPVKYSSSDEDVVYIDEDTGEITLKGAGPATITATFEGNESYIQDEVSCDITVTDSRTVPVISMSTETVNLTESNYSGFTGRTATVDPESTNDLPINLVYTKTDASSIISSLNESTGAIALSGNTGSAIVTVSFSGSDEYKAAESKSYTIKVASASGPVLLDPPASPAITAIAPTTFAATWTAADNASGYFWKLSTSNDPTAAAVYSETVQGGSTETVTKTGLTLTTGTNYYFHIMSLGDDANFSDSDTYSTSAAKQFKTYTMTIDSSNNGDNNVHWTGTNVTSLSFNNVSWTTSVTGTTSVTPSTSYAQIGSKSNPATQIVLSTSAFAGKKIISAHVTCFCMSNTGPTITIKAGSSTMLDADALIKTDSTTHDSTTGNVTMGNSDALTYTFNSR